jgi:hypothetical protein
VQGLCWFEQNVLTFSHRWLALLASLIIKLVVGVRNDREREKRLSSHFIRVKVELRSCGVES